MPKKSELFNRVKSPKIRGDEPAATRKAEVSKQKGFKGGGCDDPASYFKKTAVRQAH